MDRALIVTKKGRDLIADCLTGKELTFTRVVLGDGELPVGVLLSDVINLYNSCMELPIKSCTRTGTGTAIIKARLSNSDLKQGFWAREIGIFAKGEGADEILFAYRNQDESEYIPAGGGAEVWDYIYNYTTVVDNCENITAIIDGDLVYVSQADYDNHLNSSAPHTNFMKIGGEVKEATVFNVNFKEAGDRLDYITADNARLLILGDSSNIPMINSRVRQLETENLNLRLQLEALKQEPASCMLLSENFEDASNIDTLMIKVTACAAGDDTIDVESHTGLRIGSWYWISDGITAEQFRIKSVIKNGTVLRVLAESDLVNTYNLEQTYLYRTTSTISKTTTTESYEEVVVEEQIVEEEKS